MAVTQLVNLFGLDNEFGIAINELGHAASKTKRDKRIEYRFRVLARMLRIKASLKAIIRQRWHSSSTCGCVILAPIYRNR